MSLQDWMEPARHAERANSFGPAAKLYDQVRPDYPSEAVAWALEPLGAGSQRVVDIGAGTGIMTRRIAALGHTPIAVEPDPGMRERLVQATPGVEVVNGRAESLPFADATVDAVIAAQAYHWFDRDRAHAELARVLRPDGAFAAIWNERDETADWLRRYSLIVEGDRRPDGAGANASRRDISFGEDFTPVELRLFRHAVRHTAETLVDLLKSRSYFLTASPQRQQALVAQVRELALTHSDLAGRAEFELPYVTQVFRATRR